MPRLGLLLLALACASCERGPPPGYEDQTSPAAAGTPATSAGPTASTPDDVAVRTPLLLTPDGYGPVKIGMSETEVAAALGGAVEGVTGSGDDCHILTSPGDPTRSLSYMIEGGRLVRISAHRDSPARTGRGIAIGAPADAVRRAYGAGLQVEPAKYVDAPAAYLTFWTVPGQRGIRFETDQQQIVRMIHAGGPAIQYVEGCS